MFPSSWSRMTLACALALAGLGVAPPRMRRRARPTARRPGRPARRRRGERPGRGRRVAVAEAEDRTAPYPHGSVWRDVYGTGARSYWLFEPAEPTPERAPVVVFHHGWLAINPGVYGAWIEHLVRSGAVVIFPRYQADCVDPAGRLPAQRASRRARRPRRARDGPGHTSGRIDGGSR